MAIRPFSPRFASPSKPPWLGPSGSSLFAEPPFFGSSLTLFFAPGQILFPPFVLRSPSHFHGSRLPCPSSDLFFVLHRATPSEFSFPSNRRDQSFLGASHGPFRV